MYRQLISILLLVSAQLACSDSEFAAPDSAPAVTTRPANAEEIAANNAATRGSLRTALIVTLDIRDRTIALNNAQVMKVPVEPPPGPDGAGRDFVIVRGSNGQVVGRAFVPRQRVRIREGQGLIRSPNQVTTLAIALTGRPATIEVTVAGRQTPLGPVSLADVASDYCARQPKDAICQPAAAVGN